MFIFMMGMSLNPYFFGKCSTASLMEHQLRMLTIVLILIFLENALRQRQQNLMANYSHIVLILIFLENALRLYPPPSDYLS